MSWLPSLGAWPFAMAGIVGAIGTIAIHLLNRRRHQVLEWGAVEFLQRAMKRNRRVIQLRDAILLALRTLAVLLFGLALARPHYSDGETLTGPQPIHAIVVIDNSMSMGYRTLDGSLLSQAKQFATRLVDRLPDGSHISVVSSSHARQIADDELVGPHSSEHNYGLTKLNAHSEIDHITTVDASANLNEILSQVRTAADFETNQPHQVIIFTDLQRATWANSVTAEAFSNIKQLHIVNVAPPQQDNTFISAIDVQDGFAEAGVRSTIQVTVERSGGTQERQIEVALLVSEQYVGSKSITLQPGPTSQLVSFEHLFEIPVAEIARPQAVHSVQAVLTPDRLPNDDSLQTWIPILPRLPILFVDQFGSHDEDVRRGRIGETRALRKLLQSDHKQDIREVADGVRHVTMDDLTSETIADASVIVIAGVANPKNKVALLRQFVEEGGQLLIAAGGDFSPKQWRDDGWLDGNGLLPAPLTGNSVGETPDRSQGELAPWLIDFDSLRNSRWVHLPGVGEETLRDLYAEPLFFKVIKIDASTKFSSAYRVVAALSNSLDDNPPLLLERQIGEGRILFFTSAITSNWNTLSKSNAVVMLDRVVREMIRDSIGGVPSAKRKATAESSLTQVTDLASLSQLVDVRMTRSGDEIRVAEGSTLGNSLWWWLALIVFVLLIAESVILASAHRKRRFTNEAGWAT